MKKFKRLLAAVMAVAMLATFIPAGALAAEGDEGANPPSEQVIAPEKPDTGEPDAGEPDAGKPDSEMPKITEIGVYIGGEYVKAVEDESSLLSLMPLNSKNYTLNLTDKFPSELKAVTLKTVIDQLQNESSSSIGLTKTPAVWARWGYYDEDYNEHTQTGADYVLYDESKTIDLYSYSGNRQYIELILGTADQFDKSNFRYIVTIYTTTEYSMYYDLLNFSSKSESGSEIQIYTSDYNQWGYYDDDTGHYSLNVNPENWNNGRCKLSFGLKNESNIWTNKIASYTQKVYTGVCTNEADLTSATDITSTVWINDTNQNPEGYLADYRNFQAIPQFTLVLTKDGSAPVFIPFGVYMQSSRLEVYLDYSIYKSSSNSNQAGYHSGNKDVSGMDEYGIYKLINGNDIDSEYYVHLSVDNPAVGESQRFSVSNIKKARVGNLSKTEIEASSDTEIKTSLFSSSGYKIKFDGLSKPIYFTVLDINDRVWHLGMEIGEIEPEETLPRVPTPLSQDTYFRMQGASDGSEQSTIGYTEYVMPFAHDSYYYMGYQTVLLLDSQNNAVSDNASIKPTFWTGSKVKVFAGQNVNGAAVGAVEQKSGENVREFKHGEVIEYSAAAENKVHLKNYFVTFLTQTNEPTLFVNGTNDESNWQEDPNYPGDETKKMAARVVNLTQDYNYHHDIFFANLGKTDLTGLSVELTGPNGTGGATNVKLDDYWTIKDNSTVPGFISVEEGKLANGGTDNYGELANVGKVRLVPVRDEKGNIAPGKIEGRLIFKVNGEVVQEILLTGTSGTFQIVTDKLLDGVKHVSYSSLIQTNYITDGTNNAVSFSATGLPSGIQMLSNGELYGVPTVTGTFNITVTATCTERVDGTTVTRTDSKSYTLTIADNRDMPVWQYDQVLFAGDLTYTPTIAIPNENYDGTNMGNNATADDNNWSDEEQEIYCAGIYGDFLDRVFLDGVQLTPGVDYRSEDGSTRIVIKTQTLRSQGNGTHTISAEFRSSKSPDATLRRTAQNYTLTTLGINNRPTGGGSSSSSGSGSSNSSGSSSESRTRYDIDTSSKTQNGTYTVSPDKATEGTRVTITLSPAYGYEPDQVIVTDKDGKQVSVEKISDNKYAFRMPASKVDVKVTFKLKEYTPGIINSPFVDVDPNAWYADAISYVYGNGLMVGVGGYAFEPNTIVERSMLVTVLYNLEDQPDNAASYFSDVPLNQWYTKPVSWAVESGIISGYGDGRFGPNDSLTREQMSVILYNYAKMKGYDMSQQNNLNQFEDADSVSDFAQAALQWANAVGLISGYGNGILEPQGSATRAQLAMILMNFCENVAQ